MTSLADLNSNIGLRTLPLSYGAYSELMYKTFASADTLVLLDTNVLAIPFRFHSAARTGFFSMFKDSVTQGRLKIPAWVSNEFFFNAFKVGDSSRPHGFAVSTKNLIGTVPNTAHVRSMFSRIVSDSDLSKLATKYGVAPADVLAKVENLFQGPSDFLEAIGAELDAEMVHAELEAEFKDCHCSLDFQMHCAVVSEHADRRRANRIPPGLLDSDKGTDERRGSKIGNVDGDLALWLEILEIVKKARLNTSVQDGSRDTPNAFANVLVITEEKKPDFLYPPRFRQSEHGSLRVALKLPENKKPVISLVDPRLVSEFEATTGHRNIAFVNLEHLVDGWIRLNPASGGSPEIRHFARALSQLNDRSSTPAESVVSGDLETTSSSLAPTLSPEAVVIHDAVVAAVASTLTQNSSEPTLEPQVANEAESLTTQNEPALLDDAIGAGQQTLAIPNEALVGERNYIAALPEGPYKEIIEEINVHNWYVQNPAVQRLSSNGLPPEVGVAFVLGRAIYQAADGSAWRAAEYLESFAQNANDPSDSHQAFLAGAAYEIFFHHDGQFRAQPKAGLAEDVLPLLQHDKWAPARLFIRTHLRPVEDRFYSLPGQPAPQVRVQFVVDTISENQLIVSGSLHVPGFNNLTVIVPRTEDHNFTNSESDYDERRLKDALSSLILVPKENIIFVYDGADPLDINTLHFHPDFVFSYDALHQPIRSIEVASN